MQYKTRLRYVDALQYSGSNLEEVKVFVAPRLVTQEVGSRLMIDSVEVASGQFIVIDEGVLSAMDFEPFAKEYEAVS